MPGLTPIGGAPIGGSGSAAAAVETTITFKNGLPLLLQPAPGSDVGLVAADTGCCCPPPPPERCWNCLGSCAYDIEIEAPQGVSAKSAANFCQGPSGSGTNQSVFLYPDQAPGTLTFKFTSAQAYNSGGGGEILGASVSSVGEVDNAASCEFSGYGSIPASHVSAVLLNVSVFCREVESGSPFFVRIGGYITSGTNYEMIIGTEGQCASGWQWYFEGEYQIPSECVVSPSQQCDGYDGEFRQITTPLTFTIDGTGSSLGAFSSSSVSTQYESAQTFELVESVGEDLRDAFTATIHITARENCDPPCPVGCDTNPAVTVSWETITIPDDCPSSPCGAWVDNDGTYVRTLRTASGDGLIIPSGVVLELIDDVCYLAGYVGTGKLLSNATAEEGECRYVGIIWKWKLAYPNCDVASAGPYTLTPEFYSGYQTIFTNGSETNSDIFSALGGCFSMSAPSVTLEFPP